MKFEYTGRHVEVTPAIRRHVEDQFKKLGHVFDNVAGRTHIIIEVEKGRQKGEVLVHWRDHTLMASDTNVDMYMALTRAIGKIEKQALKLKTRLIDRTHTAKKSSTVAPNSDVEASPRPPRIISARRYTVKPMTPEEAAMVLAGKADQFVVFRDADTNRLGVLYKRQDGNFGLIEP